MRSNELPAGPEAVDATAAAVLEPGFPPPQADAPAPPKTWDKARRLKPRQGRKPLAEQVGSAPAAARELRASTTWVDDFGPNAPDPVMLAQGLETAAAWRVSWEKATRWLEFCSEQRRIWEDSALARMQELEPMFDYASEHDLSIARRYAATRRIFAAPSEAAQRGARARAKGRKKATAAAPELAIQGTDVPTR